MATKEEVIDYVMTTPSNPNKAVLSGMLDSIANAGDGSNPMIVHDTWNSDIEQGTLDKTYGEIRNAFESGQLVYVIRHSVNENETNGGMAIVYDVGYQLSPEYENAVGTISTGATSYSVSIHEAPYTLEALDAEYPFYN